MTYEARLDETTSLAKGDGTSSSTVVIAQDGHRSLHWGNASYRGESRPIAVLKFGFLEITVDEHVAGKSRLQALRDTFYSKDARIDATTFATTTPTDRHDAATAAVTVGHFEIAASIEPHVLLDLIVLDIIDEFARSLTPEVLCDFIDAALQVAQDSRAAGLRDGREDAKAELRQFLGI